MKLLYKWSCEKWEKLNTALMTVDLNKWQLGNNIIYYYVKLEKKILVKKKIYICLV